MTFKSIAEFLDPKNGHCPTSAERKLVAATQAGEPCRLWEGDKPSRPTGPSDTTTIRADLLRLLILGGTKDCGLHESGVWLEGGWIEDELDLSYCTGKGAVVLDHCGFQAKPNLARTILPLLSLDSSALPGLFAQGAQIAGDLFLRQITAMGTVAVNGAKIGGQLECIGAKLDGGKDAQGTALMALNAQGVKVGQNLFLRQATAMGTVVVTGAKIGGQLDCTGAKLDGGTDAQGTTLDALNAQGVKVGQSLFLRQATAMGTVYVNGAKIGGQLDCTGAKLDGGKDAQGTALMALNTQAAEVGQDLFLRQITAIGTLDVNGAKIGGQLDCTGATLDGGKDKDGTTLESLNGQRLQVSQSFFFRESAKVQGLVNLTAAHFCDLVDDPDCWPVMPDSLILDGLTYDRIDGPTIFSAREEWLKAGSHWLGDFYPQPYTQLAKVLTQMGHASEARKVLREREKLLAKHRLATEWQQYQLALHGDAEERGDAGWIWLRMRGAQFWAWLTRWVTGYGYAPQNALYLSLAIVGLSAIVYGIFWMAGVMVPTDAVILTSTEWATAYDGSAEAPSLVWASGKGPATQHYETYYSLPYALDVFLPIVDLGQQSTWGQTTVTTLGKVARVYTWLLQAAGYVVTSLGLAAATGIIQRNQPD